MQNPLFKNQVLVGLVFFSLILSSCTYIPWYKPKTEPVAEKRVEQAKERLKKDPDNVVLRKEAHLTKETAITELMTQAEQARLAKDLEGAKRAYERVLSISPENSYAKIGLVELERLADQNKKIDKATELSAKNQLQLSRSLVHAVLLENPQQPNALQLKKQLDEKGGDNNLAPPKLKAPFEKPVSLELRDANIKVVFDALSRATGINFILDKDIRPDTRATIFVKKLPIEDAIDMVLSSNGLQKKVLSENSILIYSANTQKLKDYQDLIMRNFYLTNTTAKQVSSLLKTMLKTKDVYVDERLNMLIMRDTPEVIRLAEKLIASVDLEDPEVMLDIEVLEVGRSRLQELGIVYPNQLSVINGTNPVLTLEALRRLKEATTAVSPNPAVNFKKTTGDVNLLSNPRIRVKNNEKAKILVGDKVPIITTTSTANVGVSESVQYVDVGLKLDVEPRVTLDNFVNIKVGLEVSSLGEKVVTKNGATVYTIGTRNTSTALHLKSGETQILAGLILDDERKNASKLPGLGDIPIVGRLFANQEDKKSKTEIVLAITPRVIGNIPLPKAEFSEYWSGTENLMSDKVLSNGGAGTGQPGQPYNQPSGQPMSASERLQEQRREREMMVETPQTTSAEQAPTQLEPAQMAPMVPPPAQVPPEPAPVVPVTPPVASPLESGIPQNQ